MRCRSCAGFAFAVAAVAAPQAVAQDVYDLPWRVAENGELEVRPLANTAGAKELQFGEWLPMFPGLFTRAAAPRDDLAWLCNYGPMMAVPLLIHGDGGAAAIDEATLRLRKLGIPTTIDNIALTRLQPDALTDLLHVRHVATFDLGATSMALREFANDKDRDPFVRAAAAAAIVARPSAEDYVEGVAAARRPRGGAAALQSGLAQLPDDVDLVIGVHGAAMPPTVALLRAWREFLMRHHSSVVASAGGSVGPAQMSTGQLVMDRPGQLPFEIARRCGNWRVDHALLGLRGGDNPGFWLHLGGVFQPARIAAGLQAGNFVVHAANDTEVRATVHGVRVHVTTAELVAWPEDFEPGRFGSRVPTLHDRAANAAAPLWLHVPANSRFTASFAPGCTFDAQLDPARATATASAACPTADGAAKLLAAWDGWRAARRCDPEGKVEADREVTWSTVAKTPPGFAEWEQSRLVWRRLVQNVHAQRTEGALAWKLDLTPFSLVDLVRLLGSSPADFDRW